LSAKIAGFPPAQAECHRIADDHRGEAAQCLSPTERFGVLHPKLIATLLRMEQHVQTPLAPEKLAKLTRVSLRCLERLFCSTSQHHYPSPLHAIRLERARVLLRQATIAVAEIAFAIGFATSDAFFSNVPAHFGVTEGRKRKPFA
jgi:transcriptional regulator GlxA family with amidase domain